MKNKNLWSHIVKKGNPTNTHVSARNLQPKDLGAVIFGCTNETIAECHSRQLFGLPRSHFSYVKNIKEGLPLFLFNYDERNMHGIYEAASNGRFCPESNAWSVDAKGKTSFPAQVAMRVRMWCIPLAESDFSKAIRANYYQKVPSNPAQKLHYFWFELDHAQTQALMDMFTPSPSPNSFQMLSVAARGRGHLGMPFPAPVWLPKNEVNKEFKPQKVAKSYADVVNENKHVGSRMGGEDIEHSSSSKESSAGFDEFDCKETPLDWEDLALSNEEVEAQQHQQSGQQEKRLDFNSVLEKLKVLSMQKLSSTSYANATKNEDVDAYSSKDMQGANRGISEGHSYLPDNDQLSSGNSNLPVQADDFKSFTESKLIEAVKELSGRIETMEKKQAWSDKEIKHLQDVNDKLRKRIVELMDIVKELNLKVDPSIFPEDSLNQFVEQCLGSEDFIYLIGGFNGFSVLSSLDAFSPSLDILTPLKPMSIGKSYTSAVALHGKIFVLGGGDGTCWSNTVDCYDRSSDDWISCPTLTCDKGSLAGVSLNGKIYAFGGGDGNECFSEVEIFDPNQGQWIKDQSMLEKRFTLAGVELNGAIYAVGGFDGNQYLRSAERLDPREPCWKRLPMMSTRRGCHTLAVLDEKIYSIGGYDIENRSMISTVEIYEPRMPSWVMAEPMSIARGYHSSAVLGGSIFVFGGVKGEADTMLDVVECYKEERGWMKTGLKSIGRRCYCSAIVL